MLLPWLASSLAAAYPEAAHMRVPMLVFSVGCLIPIQAAAVFPVLLGRELERLNGFGTRESRAAAWLRAMAPSLAASAVQGLAELVWASVETADFGMQPGIGLALILFSVGCLAAAGFVWRGNTVLRPRLEAHNTLG